MCTLVSLLDAMLTLASKVSNMSPGSGSDGLSRIWTLGLTCTNLRINTDAPDSCASFCLPVTPPHTHPGTTKLPVGKREFPGMCCMATTVQVKFGKVVKSARNQLSSWKESQNKIKLQALSLKNLSEQLKSVSLSRNHALFNGFPELSTRVEGKIVSSMQQKLEFIKSDW